MTENITVADLDNLFAQLFMAHPEEEAANKSREIREIEIRRACNVAHLSTAHREGYRDMLEQNIAKCDAQLSDYYQEV